MELNNKKIELEQALTKIRQEMIDVEENENSDSQEMNQRLKEERTALEQKYKEEDDNDQKDLDDLVKLSDQLTKDMNKLDMDSNDSRRMEEAKELLECPICMKMMTARTRIWMCRNSHTICEE